MAQIGYRNYLCQGHCYTAWARSLAPASSLFSKVRLPWAVSCSLCWASFNASKLARCRAKARRARFNCCSKLGLLRRKITSSLVTRAPGRNTTCSTWAWWLAVKNRVYLERSSPYPDTCVLREPCCTVASVRALRSIRWLRHEKPILAVMMIRQRAAP